MLSVLLKPSVFIFKCLPYTQVIVLFVFKGSGKVEAPISRSRCCARGTQETPRRGWSEDHRRRPCNRRMGEFCPDNSFWTKTSCLFHDISLFPSFKCPERAEGKISRSTTGRRSRLSVKRCFFHLRVLFFLWLDENLSIAKNQSLSFYLFLFLCNMKDVCIRKND